MLVVKKCYYLQMIEKIKKQVRDYYQKWVAREASKMVQSKTKSGDNSSLEDWLQVNQQLRKRNQTILFAVLFVLLLLIVAGGFYLGSDKSEQDEVVVKQDNSFSIEASSEKSELENEALKPEQTQELIDKLDESVTDEKYEQLLQKYRKLESSLNSAEKIISEHKLKEVAQQKQKPEPDLVIEVKAKQENIPLDPAESETVESKPKIEFKLRTSEEENRLILEGKGLSVSPEKNIESKPEVKTENIIQRQDVEESKSIVAAEVEQEIEQKLSQQQEIQERENYVQLGAFNSLKRASAVMNDLRESRYAVELDEVKAESGEKLYILRDYSVKSYLDAEKLKKIYDGWLSVDSKIVYKK